MPRFVGILVSPTNTTYPEAFVSVDTDDSLKARDLLHERHPEHKVLILGTCYDLRNRINDISYAK